MCPITECFAKGESDQRLAQLAAGVQSSLIRRFLADHAVTDQIRALALTGFFPCAHPFAVAPAVGAEQRNLLAGEFALAALKHGGELGVLQFFGAHGGAAEGDSVEAIHLIAIEFSGGKQFGFRAGLLCALRNGLGHGFGITGAAPINNCDFHNFNSFFLDLSTGYGEPFDVSAFVNVMYAGRIVETGTTDEIYYAPAHPYTWGLLSAMPDLDTEDDRLYTIPGSPPNLLHPVQGDAFAPRNVYALNIDERLEPPMFKITDTHYAATWLLDPRAPKVELPPELKARIERMKKEAR